MKKNKLISLLIGAMLMISCNPTDIPTSEYLYYIENNTDADIELFFNRTGHSSLDKHFYIKINERVQAFYHSGLNGVLPEDYDSAIVKYKNLLLIDTLIYMPGLLHSESYIEYDTEEKKKMTSHYSLFTIDEAYINAHIE